MPRCRQCPEFADDPLPPNSAFKMVKMCIFLEEFDPFCQLPLAGGGGRASRKLLDSRVLLALRQFPPLAGRGLNERTLGLRGWLAGASKTQLQPPVRACVYNSQAPRNPFCNPCPLPAHHGSEVPGVAAPQRRAGPGTCYFPSAPFSRCATAVRAAWRTSLSGSRRSRLIFSSAGLWFISSSSSTAFCRTIGSSALKAFSSKGTALTGSHRAKKRR